MLLVDLNIVANVSPLTSFPGLSVVAGWWFCTDLPSPVLCYHHAINVRKQLLSGHSVLMILVAHQLIVGLIVKLAGRQKEGL